MFLEIGTRLVMSLPGFTPIPISQLGFPPGQITTASMSFGVPLPESESEFPSYPHYPHQVRRGGHTEVPRS